MPKVECKDCDNIRFSRPRFGVSEEVGKCCVDGVFRGLRNIKLPIKCELFVVKQKEADGGK